MSGDRIRTAKTKMTGDLLRRWHGAIGLLPFLDEFKDLLLDTGQFLHSVCLDTIALRTDVKRELFTKPIWLKIDVYSKIAGGLKRALLDRTNEIDFSDAIFSGDNRCG